MSIPLWLVAIAFTIACLFCIIDMVIAPGRSRKLFRFFQGIVCGFASNYYWEAFIYGTIPSASLRLVWVVLCIVIISEIVSRWPLGGLRYK